MAISTIQSSQIELPDWLGVIGTTRRRGTHFFTKIEQPYARKTPFRLIRANPRFKTTFCACAPCKAPALRVTSFQSLPF
jgi:hypothetical protein